MTPPIFTMTPILYTPIKVGMCFGIPENEGIKMVLIISYIPGEMFVCYAYFCSGKVSVHKEKIRQNNDSGETVRICHVWDHGKVILL